MSRPWLLASALTAASCAPGSPVVCDAILDPGEDCDDGNSNDGDGCDCGGRAIAPADSTAPGMPIVIEEDGVWCWFQDERAVFVDDRIVVGTVSHGGDVQVSSYDLVTGARTRTALHRRFERDDHDAPSLLVGADGRLTAFYTKHDGFPQIYWRTTTAAGDLSSWGPRRVVQDDTDVTYTNPFLLDAEGGEGPRLYLFFRGVDLNPTFIASDDAGEHWSSYAPIMKADGHRPYVKFASDGVDTIHLFYTDGHPNEYLRNSVYHLRYEDGALRRSDGQAVDSMGPGDGAKLAPSSGTRVYDGTALPGGQAWTWDAAIDPGGAPVVVFSTYPDPGRPFFDHRYRYARWNGDAWEVSTIAHAGTGIYYVEGYYSGGIAIDPDDPRTVYFSSNVDPRTGEPAASTVFELYRGVTADGGATWSITPVTSGSLVDQLRPVVPAGHPEPTAVIWMAGSYDTYLDFETRILGLFGAADVAVPPPLPATSPLIPIARFDLAATLHGPATPTAPGWIAAVPLGGTALARDGDVDLIVANITGTRDAGWEDDLYRDAALNDRGGDAPGDKLRVSLAGLEPGIEYVVRVHGHEPTADYLHPTLWFRGDATSLAATHEPSYLGAHRNANGIAAGAGATDLVVAADPDGRIELVGRGLDNHGDDHTAVLNAIEVTARPETELVARFDVDAEPDGPTAAGHAAIWFDDLATSIGVASTGGITATVRTDRLDSLRRRTRGDDQLRDFVFGRDQLVVDLEGLVPGRTYELVVYSTDPEANLYAASRWSVEEPGQPAKIVRSFHMNTQSLGGAAAFRVFHVATSSTLRLRGADVMTSLSTDPSLVVLNGLEVRVVP